MSNIVSVTPGIGASASVIEINGREISDVLSIDTIVSGTGYEVTMTFFAAQANYVGQNARRDKIPGAAKPKGWWARMAAAYEKWQSETD